MAIPLKTPETKKEILGYWILQVREFHDRLCKKGTLTDGDWREMGSLDMSLKLAAQDAGIDLSLRPGTIYAGRKLQ